MAKMAWLTAALLSGFAFRSQPPQVFRSGVDLVRISATVTDREGRAVTTLGKDDFVLTEDDQPREITFFSRDEDTPISIVLVVDTSGSMEDKLDNVEDALRHFVATTREEDESGLIKFASSVERITPLGAGANRLDRAFRDLRARAGRRCTTPSSTRSRICAAHGIPNASCCC